MLPITVFIATTVLLAGAWARYDYGDQVNSFENDGQIVLNAKDDVDQLSQNSQVDNLLASVHRIIQHEDLDPIEYNITFFDGSSRASDIYGYSRLARVGNAAVTDQNRIKVIQSVVRNGPIRAIASWRHYDFLNGRWLQGNVSTRVQNVDLAIVATLNRTSGHLKLNTFNVIHVGNITYDFSVFGPNVSQQLTKLATKLNPLTRIKLALSYVVPIRLQLNEIFARRTI